MRQQLITWLIDDIAPEIRRSRDAEGTILKFASEQNLAPSLVQAIGQLYNTAKTIAFLEKSGSKGRGESFPILDVESMVAKYIDAPKEAGVSEGTIDRWELDSDSGVSELPACFQGMLTPVYRSETVENPVPNRMVKKAFADIDITKVNQDFAEQFMFETREDMIKDAGAIVRYFRTHPEYTFEELEADAMGYYGDRIKPVMDKIASFCEANRWPISRAKAATENKLLGDHPTRLLELVNKIDDGLFKLKEARSYLDKQAADTKTKMDVTRREVPQGPPGYDDNESSERRTPSSTTPSPDKPQFKDYGHATMELPKRDDAKGEKMDLFGELNKVLDRVIGTKRPMMENLGVAFKGPNVAQEKVDSSMLDARHMAVLTNLMTNDEILAEADPERVTQLYNTIRESAPELSTDINVMRVLLRSAI